jgi:ArsR family transcriptional regulator, arsenate/arsenite/antimonite-responsive transcriptional repressor
MNKSGKFDKPLQDISKFSRVLSHPARLSILRYLAETKICISGDISDYLPLGRTTVSRHLKELKDLGLIHGEIEGLKVNYCLCSNEINRYLELFENFFGEIKKIDIKCSSNMHNLSQKR